MGLILSNSAHAMNPFRLVALVIVAVVTTFTALFVMGGELGMISMMAP